MLAKYLQGMLFPVIGGVVELGRHKALMGCEGDKGMKKRAVMGAALMVSLVAVCSCKGKGAKVGAAGATVEITDASPLSDYVKSYLSDKIANEIGDTSLEAIEAAITGRVEDAVNSELEEIMADGFAVVDTQLTADGKGTYRGDVVVTYMTPPANVASQSKANVAVQVNRGFFSWEIEE